MSPIGIGFRFYCYSEFGWTYQEVMKLPLIEAAKLAVFIHERNEYQQEQQSNTSHGGWEVETFE